MRILGYQEGFLLYENKSNNDLLCIPVKMDVKNAAAIDEALEWMRTVWKAHKDDTLPTRPFTKKSPICKDCPFYNVCWEEDAREGEVTIAPMKVADF
jgi:CRISPR/Cas system-associated exonuclease Cas4 (RecB family)